jgi:hypothetical protein
VLQKKRDLQDKGLLIVGVVDAKSTVNSRRAILLCKGRGVLGLGIAS